MDRLSQDYFEPVVGEDGNPTGALKPKMLSLALPHHVGDKVVTEAFEVPVYTLVKHQAMLIDTLKIHLEVDLHGLGALETSKGNSTVLASTTRGTIRKKPTTASVEIVFKGSDPPEGSMQINDKLVKSLPD